MLQGDSADLRIHLAQRRAERPAAAVVRRPARRGVLRHVHLRASKRKTLHICARSRPRRHRPFDAVPTRRPFTRFIRGCRVVTASAPRRQLRRIGHDGVRPQTAARTRVSPGGRRELRIWWGGGGGKRTHGREGVVDEKRSGRRHGGPHEPRGFRGVVIAGRRTLQITHTTHARARERTQNVTRSHAYTRTRLSARARTNAH